MGEEKKPQSRRERIIARTQSDPVEEKEIATRVEEPQEPDGILTQNQAPSKPRRERKPTNFTKGKGLAYFEAKIDPENASLSIAQIALIAGVHKNTAYKIEKDPEFHVAWRKEKVMRQSHNLSMVDMEWIDVLQNGKNENARVNAGDKLLKRWDPDYADRKETQQTISFVAIVREAFG